MKKTTVACALTVLTVFVFQACSSDSTNPSRTVEKQTSTSQPTSTTEPENKLGPANSKERADFTRQEFDEKQSDVALLAFGQFVDANVAKVYMKCAVDKYYDFVSDDTLRLMMSIENEDDLDEIETKVSSKDFDTMAQAGDSCEYLLYAS